MRWEALFDDLEAQLAQQEARELSAEISERVRAERARVSLAERLLSHLGRPLRLRLGSGELAGVVRDVAPAWLVLNDPSAQVLVPISAIVTVEGLGRAAALPPGKVLRSLGFGHALRALARDRAAVRVQTSAGALHGTIDRVGADHLDLAQHEPGQYRRPGNVASVATVAFAHVDWVRSALQ